MTIKTKKTIPVGYQLHVHSWENDADARGTEILSGLSKEDVAFYVELLSYFRSGSNGKDCYGNGTGEVKYGDVARTIKKVLDKHPGVSEEIKDRFDLSDVIPEDPDEDEENEDALSDATRDVMYDLLGSPATYEYQFRVFDRFEVYYFSKPVEDVTSEFTK